MYLKRTLRAHRDLVVKRRGRGGYDECHLQQCKHLLQKQMQSDFPGT